MPFEELMLKLCTSMDNLADAMRSGDSAASTAVADKPAEGAKRGRPSKEDKAAASGPTHDDALAVGKKLAAAKDKAVVGKLVQTHGGAGKRISDLPKDKIAAFIAAAEVMLNEKEEDEEADDDEI